MANKIWNFICYCMAFVLYGSIITAMGPVIPFLSEETGKPEPYFSFIFFCRAIGYIFGGVIVKFLLERFNLHRILMGTTIIGGSSFMISTVSINFWNLSLTMFVGGSCCCIINIVCNSCVIKLYANQKQDYWIQLLHTIFGVGGLLGPFLVSFFGLKSYFILGLLLFILFPVFAIF